MRTALPPDLVAAQELAYEPNGLKVEHFVPEAESEDYAAADFRIHDCHVKFRVAKITPVKVGLFVTLWKRVDQGPIQPLDMADPFDLCVVSVRSPGHFGQFIFPKFQLGEKGIVSKEGKGGKRAFRVYPPWERVENNQALRTQKWQLPYFVGMPLCDQSEALRMQKLFFILRRDG